VSVLINVMAILGLACSILGVLLAAWFFIPAIRDRRRERRFIRQECADLAALDDPAAMAAALRRTGRQGNSA
jgi:hypothetical protein